MSWKSVYGSNQSNIIWCSSEPQSLTILYQNKYQGQCQGDDEHIELGLGDEATGIYAVAG